MKSISPPVLKALVLADYIYTEQSGKRIICGTFNRIWSSKFPGRFREHWAYILLADVDRKVVLQLRFVHLKDNQILMQSSPITIESKDPLMPLDIAIEIPGFPLPEAGIYAFECWASDDMIGSVRLQVGKLEEQSEKTND